MKYTVCILFDQWARRVLLQKKSKTEFKGMLNGVDGKIELHEEPDQSVVRKSRGRLTWTLIPGT